MEAIIPSSNDITVFVSSTSQDLEDYRAVARNVILDLDWRPKMMEHFGAMSDPTVTACGAALEDCDLVVLLVAFRQGWVPTVEQGGNGRDSVTALELAHARAKNIPVLLLLANKSWRGDLWEEEQAKREWVKAFRDGLNQPAAFFDYEEPATRLPGFRAILKENLLKYKERVLARRAPAAPAVEFFDTARDALMDGSGIPVLASGVYDDGPLSSDALVEALLTAQAGLTGVSKEQMPLATAAEFRERRDGSRQRFLNQFRRVLDQQSSKVASCPMLDVLAGLENTRLIVYATYDRVLEERLNKAERKYTIVSHVLRSCDGAKDGNIVVIRPGGDAEFFPANKVDIPEDGVIIYKPLGSPFVHDKLDPDLEIDTVVVTETDHALFLQRLHSPETGVPNPLKRILRNSPILFLGYRMNVWQYRLIMLMFDFPLRLARGAVMFAVRVPETELEEIAWNKLNTSLIRMQLDQFAGLL